MATQKTRKPGLSRDEHTELGAELFSMRNRLGKIAQQLGRAYSLQLGDEVLRVQDRIDRLRGKMDSTVFREYPNLHAHGNMSVYYPGLDPLGGRPRRRR